MNFRGVIFDLDGTLIDSQLDFDAMRRDMQFPAGEPILESVAARWTSLYSTTYTNTTPSLVAESTHGLTFDNFYAHIGRSSNSLVAMLMSEYPKLDFRDITDEYPHLPGTSLASVFQRQGYRTEFITPSDLPGRPIGSA